MAYSRGTPGGPLSARGRAALVCAAAFGASSALVGGQPAAASSAGASALGASSFSAGPASASALRGAASGDDVNQRSKELAKQMAALRESLEGAKSDFVEAAVALKESEAGLATARAALAEAQNRLAEAAARDAELASQLSVAEAEEAKAERELASRTDEEADTRKALGEIARSAYVGNQVTGLSIVLQAESAEELTERLAVAGAALRAQNGAIERLSVQQAEMRAQGSKLTAVRAQVAELKRQSAIVVEQRKAAQVAAAEAETQVSALVVRQQGAVQALEGKIQGERERLDAMQAEQDKLKAVLAARAKAAAEAARRRAAKQGSSSRSRSSAPASGGTLGSPVSAPVSSSFGMRYHPILHIYRMHTGIDFSVGCGTPVYAAADGQVISSGGAGGYGNRVVIDHGYLGGAGLATTYNHLSRIVRYGGSVKRGQLIAYSGTTGLSTGCHLHFEALSNGSYVDPRRYM